MKNHYPNKLFSNQRVHSMIPKLQSSYSQSSYAKENNVSEVSSTKKYLTHIKKQEFGTDQTQKFLTQTKNKLYSSTNQLRQFHKKRLTYKTTKQNIDFSILSKEIKSTKQKLLSKNFVKMPTYRQKLQRIQRSHDDSSQLNEKLTLLQKALSQMQMIQFKEQLSKKISEIKKQHGQNQQMKGKVLKYYLNYQVISRFLEQAAKDTQKLILRKQNINLYYKMKDEMISLLSNQELFQTHIQEIERSQQNREKSLLIRTLDHQQRFMKVHSKPKPSSTGQKPLLDKIDELFEISKNSIKEAFFNFNKPELTYQIQLQFNKRLNDNFLKE